MSVTEKMVLWDIDPATEQGPPVDDRDNEEDVIHEEDTINEEDRCQDDSDGDNGGGDSENDEEDEATNNDRDPHTTPLAGYTDLRAFLFESEEYQWLLDRL